MEKQIITCSALSFELPEGFSVLTADDYKAMGKKAEENDLAIRNKQAHLIFEITWKKLSFLTRSASVEQACRNTERFTSKVIGSFQKTADIEKEICGEKACGFRYTYTTSGINMAAEYLVCKHNNQLIGFSLLGQTGTFDSNYGMINEFLNSVKFA